MRGFNRAIIAGNLTRDPEVRYTVKKRAYAKFGVAVNYRYKDNNGEYKDGVDYINVAAWGATAETCGKYLKKGSPILVEGRISTRTYDANDGSGKKSITEVVIDHMVMLGSGQGSSGGGSYPSSSNDDFGSFNPPTVEDFGRPISESGFGGGVNPTQGFANDNNDNMSEDDIPF